jgi:hypothetical protein
MKNIGLQSNKSKKKIELTKTGGIDEGYMAAPIVPVMV